MRAALRPLRSLTAPTRGPRTVPGCSTAPCLGAPCLGAPCLGAPCLGAACLGAALDRAWVRHGHSSLAPATCAGCNLRRGNYIEKKREREASSASHQQHAPGESAASQAACAPPSAGLTLALELALQLAYQLALQLGFETEKFSALESRSLRAKSASESAINREASTEKSASLLMTEQGVHPIPPLHRALRARRAGLAMCSYPTVQPVG